MNRRLRLVGVLVIAVALLLPGPATPARASTAARHVILILGDGMGPNHVLAGAYYVCGQAPCLSFESFPHQTTQTTHSADNATTDSAAAATAMATGTKVNNQVISVRLPGDGSELTTLLEIRRNRQQSTGLLTTAYITDASPAAFGAHEASRHSRSAIFADYLGQTRPEVLLGGGGASYGVDGTAAAQHGYSVVTTRQALRALDTELPGRVAGFFGSGLIPPAGAAGRNETLPMLTEMTAAALHILDNDPDGFFLLIESSGSDNYSHSHDASNMVAAMAEMSAAVQTVVDWVDCEGGADWSNTLVVVLSDHETGGITNVVNNGAGVVPAITWTSAGHTSTPVPVYARGVGAEQIANGVPIDNTAIAALMAPPMSGPSCKTTSFGRGEDTWLDSANPTVAHGGDSPLVADSSPDSGILLRWDLSSLPAQATIESASLTFHLASPGDASADSYEFFALRRHWTQDGATWNTFDGATAWGTAGAQDVWSDIYGDALGASPAGGSAPADVTTGWSTHGVAQLQRWVNGVEPNYGLAIIDYAAPGGDGFRVASFESPNPPLLSVTWCTDIPTAAPLLWYFPLASRALDGCCR